MSSQDLLHVVTWWWVFTVNYFQLLETLPQLSTWVLVVKSSERFLVQCNKSANGGTKYIFIWHQSNTTQRAQNFTGKGHNLAAILITNVNLLMWHIVLPSTVTYLASINTEREKWKNMCRHNMARDEGFMCQCHGGLFFFPFYFVFFGLLCPCVSVTSSPGVFFSPLRLSASFLMVPSWPIRCTLPLYLSHVCPLSHGRFVCCYQFQPVILTVFSCVFFLTLCLLTSRQIFSC